MELKSVIEGIAQNTSEHVKAVDGDYILDGLLHCGKCKTRKQTRVEMPWGTFTPYCVCKCEREKQEKEDEARARAEKIERCRRNAFYDCHMERKTFENADGSNEKIMNAMKKYVENFEQYREAGKGLLLFGTTGTGKTYAAACVANALINKGVSVKMTDFTRIENAVSDMFGKRQEYYNELNNFDLLIIDDLNTERKTEYMKEIVYNVINSRVLSGRPLIITTNLTNKELQKADDVHFQRVFSRLFEACIPIEVNGEDKRYKKLKMDIEPMKRELGLL